MVRPKTYTESEQIAILHAVLMNKDILEAPKTKSRTRTEAWRVKWEEIAATTDAYFGTNRGASSVRSLYTHWKTAAKRKHSSIQKISLSEEEYEASLTMAERILRQICPDIFRKFDDEPTTSNDKGTDNAVNPQLEKSTNESRDDVSYEEEQQSELQLPANSNNGTEANPNLPENKEMETSEATSDVEKDSEDLEEFIKRAEPNIETKNYSNPELPVLGNSDLDGLVLSLQSMIDIPSEIETAVANDPAIFENNRKMDDDIGEIVEAIKEYVHEKTMKDANGTSELKNEDAGPSVNENESRNIDEPLDLTKEVSVPNIVVTNNDESKPNEDLEKKEETVVTTVDEDSKTAEKKIEETKMEIEKTKMEIEKTKMEIEETRMEIEETIMEMKEKPEVCEEKNPDEESEIVNEPPAMPEVIPETNENSDENSEDTKEPFAESSINVPVAEKRKKKQRGRATKKRKVTKDSSTD